MTDDCWVADDVDDDDDDATGVTHSLQLKYAHLHWQLSAPSNSLR